MATTTPADLDVDRLVTGFVHVLRRGGMSITISQSTLFRAALDVVGLCEVLDVSGAGRSTLVLKQEHVAMFDAMFLAFFHHNTSGFSMRFDDVAELIDPRKMALIDHYLVSLQLFLSNKILHLIRAKFGIIVQKFTSFQCQILFPITL